MLPARSNLATVLLALFTSAAFAQTQPPPRLNYVFPMGGKAGSSIELTVTGLELADLETLHFSFEGAEAEPISSEKKIDPKKDKKDKNAKPAQMKKPAPGQSSHKFKVTIPANAPLGIHDVRLVTKGGVSNPRAFVVGDVAEVLEKEPNDDVPKAQKIELNTTINGLVPAGTDVDYYMFSGTKGQRVVIDCRTSSIDSKLPVELELFAPGGQLLGSNRGYEGNDAVLDVVLQSDGEYYVRVCSFTYTQGGPEYFYRLTIGAMPWIDAVFPPVVEAGKVTKVTLFGRNLPKGTLDPGSLQDGKPLEKATVFVKAPKESDRLGYRGHVAPARGVLDGFEYRTKNEAGSSNGVLVHFAKAPVVLEDRDNDTPEKAQKVTLPCEIAGMIEKKGDVDWYAFEGKKGQILDIESFGDRFGSPVDLYFVLQDDKGKTITRQDENAEITANQFYTRTDDPPRYRFVVPADGEYRLMVSSQYAFMQSGPRHIYSIRLAAETGDFRLVAMGTSPLNPETITLGQAGNQVLTILAFREGNFTGDITLSAKDLPPGLSIVPQVVSSHQKQANLVISAAAEAPPFVGAVRIVGTAIVSGNKVEREVRSASITWPVAQTAPTISRLDRELVLAVRDRAPYTLIAQNTKVQIPLGDKISIPVKINRAGDFTQSVNVVALNLPPGLTLQQPVTLEKGKDAATVVLGNKGTVLPGNYTLVLRGQTQPVNMKPNNNQKKGGEPGNYLQASGPIALTIIPKSLAKVSLPGNVKIPAGKSATVTVNVARQSDYRGPFKVELVDPKGVSAEETTIPAGKDEAKLSLTADDAKAGANTTVLVRVTAMFNDTIPIVHEAKLNVSFTK